MVILIRSIIADLHAPFNDNYGYQSLAAAKKRKENGKKREVSGVLYYACLQPKKSIKPGPDAKRSSFQ